MLIPLHEYPKLKHLEIAQGIHKSILNRVYAFLLYSITPVCSRNNCLDVNFKILEALHCPNCVSKEWKQGMLIPLHEYVFSNKKGAFC